MPETYFTILLPDGVTKECYSPSTVVLKHFSQGEEMSVAEFLSRSRAALEAAGKRVREKYGFACSSAAAQIDSIEEWARSYETNAMIRILHI